MFVARKLRPYFQAHKIVVITSDLLKKFLQKPEGLGRLILWAVELSEFDSEYTPRKAIKAQVLAEVLASRKE